MNLSLKVTVCELNEEDNRVNFNFLDESNLECWCVGPIKGENITNPNIGQFLAIHGNWLDGSTSSHMYFSASHIELLSDLR